MARGNPARQRPEEEEKETEAPVSEDALETLLEEEEDDIPLKDDADDDKGWE